MSALILWIASLLRWRLGWLRVGLFLLLSMRRRRALPFLPFAFLRRSFGFRLLPTCKQLWKHLLEGVDRFLLGANHIELFPLGLGLLFKAPGYLLRSVCHIREGFLLYRRVRGLRFSNDSAIRLLQCLRLGHYNRLGLPHQFECGYASTLLLVQFRLVRADIGYFLLLLLGVVLGPAIFAVTLGYSI